MPESSRRTWKFNRGEWTEAYVFLKVLGVGRIYGMDAVSEKNTDVYLDIVNVIRNEGNSILRFERTMFGETPCEINVFKDDVKISVVASAAFNDMADSLYNSIKTGRNRSMEIPETQCFMENLGISSPKANISDEFRNLYGAKTDIIFTSGDSFDGMRNSSGFSIKSHVGSSPTLFNCSPKSGFRYKLIGCDEQTMHVINNLGKFADMVAYIKENCLELEFEGMKSEAGRENYMFVDSNMDKIIAAMLLVFCKYSDVRADSSDIDDLVKALAQVNPLGINPDKSYLFYKAKFKEFLFDAFAGMSAVTPWSGEREIAGGYIDVGDYGEMLYCRAMSDNTFMSYLYNNTYFDTPSRGVGKDVAIAKAKAFLEGREFTAEDLHSVMYSGRTRKAPKGNFGYVYNMDGEYYFDLNFQIRFR